MSSKFTTVRLVIEGDRYEIMVNPESALSFKMGKAVEPSQVIGIDEVFSDANKGLRANGDKLKKHFGTDDHAKAAVEVLKRGELQLTQEQRHRMPEEKRRQVVAMIAKTSFDPFKDANEQLKTILDELRKILPMKSERVKLLVKAPAQYAGQTIGVLKGFGEILKEEWGGDGGLSAIIEVPAATQPSLLERLGSATRGSAQVTLV